VQNLLSEFGEVRHITLYSDALAAMGAMQRIGLQRIKHLELKYLWVQELVNKKELKLEYVNTKLNWADQLTKHLERAKLMEQCVALGLDVHASVSSDVDVVASVQLCGDSERRARSRTPMRGLRTFGGLMMLAKSVRAQPVDIEDTSSVLPLVLVIFFAVFGMMVMVCILVQQSWKRCRARPKLQSELGSSTDAKKVEHKNKVVPEASSSSAKGSSASSSSLSTRRDTQCALRRGQALRTVWARTEEQKWQGLNSICVTCKQPIVEPQAATCADCRRRIHCSDVCGRTCYCPHTLCIECLLKHKCRREP
jgi:hypothetical protein